MRWPDKPTCHRGSVDPVFRYQELADVATWRTPHRYVEPPEPEAAGPYDETWRTCSYCGSMHPEDLLAVLAGGARLGGSDWKYGWPHKFYVEDIPNPIAGKMCPSSSRAEPIFDAAGAVTGHKRSREFHPAPSHQRGKWYNAHLLDEGYDDEARFALLDALRSSGVEFFLDEAGKLKYRAPYHGYQRA